MAQPCTANESGLALLLALAGWSGTGCAVRRPAALPPPAPEAFDRWERVLALAPGSRVRVELQSGAVVEGRLQAADEKEVFVHPSLLAGAPRASVKRSALVERRVGDFSLRGLLTGVAFAAILVAGAAGSSDALPFAPVALWYGGLGAGGGALLGLTPAESVVYEATAAVCPDLLGGARRSASWTAQSFSPAQCR